MLNDSPKEFAMLLVLVGMVLMLFWQNSKLSDENRELLAQNMFLRASKAADETAFKVREDAKGEATKKAERKINEIENLAKSADGLSDDELLTHLKRLCQEDGICLTRTPKPVAQ